MTLHRIICSNQLTAGPSRKVRALLDKVRAFPILATAAFFRWALSHHEVQLVVAEAFVGKATPMCSALDHAISQRTDEEFRQIERTLEERDNVNVEAIEGLDKYMESSFEDYMRGEREAIIDGVAESLITRLRG